MKTIYFRELTEPFNEENDVIVEPYCFNSQSDFHCDNYEFPFYYHQSKREREEIGHKLIHISKKIINEIGKDLNHKHNWKFSFNFYKILLFQPVYGLISLLYDKQTRVEKILTKQNQEKYTVPIIGNRIKWKFKSNLNFLNYGIRNPKFHFYLYSRIINEINPKNWVLDAEPLDTETEFQERKASFFGKPFVKIFNLIFPNYDLSFIMPKIPNILFAFLFNLKNNKTDRREVFKANGDNSFKWKINIKELIDECLGSIIDQFVEKIYHEPKKVGRNKYFIGSSCLNFKDDWKLRAAKVVENGGGIIGWQHGGYNFGLYNFQGKIFENEYTSYKFFSWGFKEQGDKKEGFLPLPQPNYSKKNHRYTGYGNKIILMGTLKYKTFEEFDSGPTLLDWIEIRKTKKEIIGFLYQNFDEDFTYRSYPNQKIGLSDNLYLKRFYPKLTLDTTSRARLHESLLNCKLLILDHPGTTLNLALSANIPTICFWKKDHYHFCEQAEKEMKKLEDVGIVFRRDSLVQDFSDHVQKVDENIMDWWMSEKVQIARENWCNNYARTSYNWKSDWIKAIKKLN